MPRDIETEMADELTARHRECQQQIREAAEAVKTACKSSEYLGQLVEKVSRHRKQSWRQWLAERGIDSESSGAYKLAHTTQAKRCTASDRRLLLKLGIIQPQIKSQPSEKVTRSPKSLGSKVEQAKKNILGHIEKQRPVEDMTPSEVIALKSQLEPLARLYVKVSQK